jgi:hypothetical protein
LRKGPAALVEESASLSDIAAAGARFVDDLLDHVSSWHLSGLGGKSRKNEYFFEPQKSSSSTYFDNFPGLMNETTLYDLFPILK